MSAKKTITAFLILGSLAAILYHNSLNIPMTFDDMHLVSENTYLTQLKYWPVFFKGYVTSFPIAKGMFRPMLMFSYMANYALHGLSLPGYHLVNIIVHLINAFLIFFIFRHLSLKDRFWVPLLASALFLCHPLNTEAVNYISCRSDLMLTLFILAGMLFYMKNRLLPAFICYLSALLTKETGLCFIFLIISYEFIFRRSDNISFKLLIKNMKTPFMIFLTAAGIAYWYYRKYYFSPPAPIFIRPLFDNMLTQSAVTFLYLKLFFIPYPLQLIHFFPILHSLTAPLAFVSVLGLSALAALVFLLRRKAPLVSFGLIWLLVGLLPKFYARLNYVACEHHFYLPGIGLFMIALYLFTRVKRKKRTVLVCAGAALMVLFTALVWQRNQEWNDPAVFWEKEAELNPYSCAALNMAARYYESRGDLKKTEDSLNRAYYCAPNLFDKKNTLINLARLYSLEGKSEKAVQVLEGYFEDSPIPVRAFKIRGFISLRAGDEQEALSYWLKEIEIYPQLADSYLTVGMHYFKKNEKEKAVPYFQKTLGINPMLFEPYYALGTIAAQQGEPEKALFYYRNAVNISPEDKMANYSLGSLLLEKGKAEGIKYLKMAIKNDPHMGKALNDLAVAYASMDPPQWESARRFADRAKKEGFPVSSDFLEYLSDHKQ